jgi:hypothetical protein
MLRVTIFIFINFCSLACKHIVLCVPKAKTVKPEEIFFAREWLSGHIIAMQQLHNTHQRSNWEVAFSTGLCQYLHHATIEELFGEVFSVGSVNQPP